VYHELQDVLGDSPDSAPTYDQLQRLDLLTRVIKETMRLFPAAPVIARSAPYEVQCGDYTIPAGASIAIFIYGLHRHPQLWNNPNQFDPDRFLPSQSSHRNPSAMSVIVTLDALRASIAIFSGQNTAKVEKLSQERSPDQLLSYKKVLKKQQISTDR
ncbi:cytochrome P450 4V2-like, partial [Diaphorina citri]|uniref:Cytochrome P450 4V2-like n=1 Tax=Diaphorina citri TaxID=121845 RepID=A0A1S3DJE9_DIACI